MAAVAEEEKHMNEFEKTIETVQSLKTWMDHGVYIECEHEMRKIRIQMPTLLLMCNLPLMVVEDDEKHEDDDLLQRFIQTIRENQRLYHIGHSNPRLLSKMLSQYIMLGGVMDVFVAEQRTIVRHPTGLIVHPTEDFLTQQMRDKMIEIGREGRDKQIRLRAIQNSRDRVCGEQDTMIWSRHRQLQRERERLLRRHGTKTKRHIQNCKKNNRNKRKTISRKYKK